MIDGLLSFSDGDMSFRFNIRLDDTKFTQHAICETFMSQIPYEPEVVWCLKEKLKEGSTFLDIGSHVGYHSLIARSLVGSTGNVYCLEPDTYNFNILSENIDINSFENVHAFKLGAYDKTGKELLFVNLDNDGGHCLWDCSKHAFNKKTRENPTTVEIDMITIDDFVTNNSIQCIDLMKIDTEGCELLVLKGAESSISKGIIRNVVLEVHDFGLESLGGSVDELFGFMQSRGYLKAILTPNGKPSSNGFIYNALFERNHG